MKKILVIEDVASTLNLFLENLKAEGLYTVIGANNGLIGVQRAQQELPDLIISDIVMSQLDGYTVLRILRQKEATASIPFIFVAAKVTQADIRKGIQMGVDDYLAKSCTAQELLKTVAVCLEKQAFLRHLYGVQFQGAEASKADMIKTAAPGCIFPSNHQLSEVFRFIETNYHYPITLRDVAVATGYSAPYLTNLVQKQTGQTVQSWIILRRMAAARFLLLETNEKIEVIATKVGYQCMVHFFRQFRQYHNTTPQAWRKIASNNFSRDMNE